MKKRMTLAALAALCTFSASAQRYMDTLDRGLIAVSQAQGNYVSWRIYGTEYYGVGYNLYRDGVKVNDAPLYVSNYTDAKGTQSSTYTVSPVVNGVEKVQCKPASVWMNDYLVIPKAKRISNDGKTDITNSFEPNDATFADVDGDGEMEVIVKQWNTTDTNAGFPLTSKDFDRIEVYKLNGKLLWWIDCGPNLTDFQHNETNIAAYDWDMDGKAECVMRAADGTIVHMADGTTFVVGDKTKNYRNEMAGGTSAFIHTGAEFLLYMNGETGKPYSCTDYPLKRLEDGETDLNKAWGDGYGHRSSKHFFGAPYFDGKHPSIFLARGIYTRHKMIAYDVDPATHKLNVRWKWYNNTGGPWYGQGYHNYSVADVDLDGRDEICFGSMVIDDTGQGLSTTGLGHGDAQHVGDFNPYEHGLEIYACNEDQPGNNFRDATTSKIYYRFNSGNDDGRAMCGNFSNEIPGAMGLSARDEPISCVTNGHVSGLTKNGVTQNFRIYWDGDLLEESFDGISGRNSNGSIHKYKVGAIKTFGQTHVNNDTKATPCFTGDIFGDWREEVALRDDDNNIRIETTTTPTQWRNYSLLHDPQYRNAMVWQMNGYNQPPHVSYFLGELEGVTMAPPAPMVNGKTEIAENGTVGSAVKGKQVLLDATNDATYTITDGAAPEILFDNAPTWVKGHTNNDNIERITYTHTLKGGAFAGNMRLVKQGDGVLVLPDADQRYTGPTDVWAGTLVANRKMDSRVWLNRFGVLSTNNGTFNKGIQMDYASELRIGDDKAPSTVTTDSLILNFGAKANIDLFSADRKADVIKAKVLKIEKKTWKNGPKYNAPVLNFNCHLADGETAIANGKYLIGEIGQVEGSLDDLIIEGLASSKANLLYEDGKLYLSIHNYTAENVTWTGAASSTWDLDNSVNFRSDKTGEAVAFVPGDQVTFADEASYNVVNVKGNLAPSKIVFNNQKTLYLQGDSLVGGAEVEKNGVGNVIIRNVNRVGNTVVKEGKITVSSLANKVGQDYGSLGDINKTITLNDGTTFSTSAAVTSAQKFILGRGEVTFDLPQTLTLNQGITSLDSRDAVLVKKGSGTLNLGTGNRFSKLVIRQGTVNAGELNNVIDLPSLVEFEGGTLNDPANIYTYSSNRINYYVGQGYSGTLVLDLRCEYYGTLTGGGNFTVKATGPRHNLNGNWSEFTGTLNVQYQKMGSYGPNFAFNNTYGMPKATLNIASDAAVNNSGKGFRVGKVLGSGQLAGSGLWTLMSDDDYYFPATTDAGTPLAKQGTGKMTLSALGRIKGSLEVKDGTLQFNDANAKTLAIGSSCTLSGTGKIVGRGFLPSLFMTGNSELTPVNYAVPSTVGVLRTNTVLNVANGSTVHFILVGNGQNSSLQAGSSLTMNGTVDVQLVDYEPKAGDSFTLWTANSFWGTPNLVLPELPAGLEWDSSELNQTTGVLKVVAATGISAIAASEVVSAEVYTLAGVKVATAAHVTKKNLQACLKRQGLATGTYVVKISNGTAHESIRVVIR